MTNLTLVCTCVFAAWRSVKHFAPEWPSWSTAGSAVWAACNISKTGAITHQNSISQKLTHTRNEKITSTLSLKQFSWMKCASSRSYQVWWWLHHHPAGGWPRPRPSASDGVHRAGAAWQHTEGETPQHAAVPAALLAHLPRPYLLPAL